MSYSERNSISSILRLFHEIVRLFAVVDSIGSAGTELILSFNGLTKSESAKMKGDVMVLCFCCLYGSKMGPFIQMFL